jgi:arginyl-tRNA--protein-N-Asp/Glu arginylyltransferase
VSGHLEHEETTRRLGDLLAKSAFGAGESFPCPYLAGREARHLTLAAERLPPGLYHAFMDQNFRRMGAFVYRPQCDGCTECRMLRVPVAAFRPSRAQRRCLARNADLAIEVGPPAMDAERQRLYARYLKARHDGQMDGSSGELRDFLYTSGVETLEVAYRLSGRLVAVGIVDTEPQCWSAVYCYFEPDLKARSLGVLNILTLLSECRRRDLAHLYLGYFVEGSPRMAYKADYRPCQVRGADGEWRTRAE